MLVGDRYVPDDLIIPLIRDAMMSAAESLASAVAAKFEAKLLDLDAIDREDQEER